MAVTKTEHKGFLGLRNNVDLEAFGPEDLEVATNVDINDARRISRRRGYGPVLLAGDFRSLWSDGTLALAVRSGTELVRINPSWTADVLRAGLAPDQFMSYAPLGARVYYSNGVDTGVVEHGRSRTWGLIAPSAQPSAVAVGGVLPAGRYQYAVTFLRSDGQESGTQVPEVFVLDEIGGIRLTSLPVSDDPDVTHLAVYFSKTNGEDAYRVGIVSNGTSSFDYMIEASMQVPLRTQHLRPAPAGQFIETFNGRMLVAAGNVLYYSEPYAPELFDLRKNYPFGGRITLLAAVDSGVYVGTDNLVTWFGGDTPEKWQYEEVLSYGAIPGAVTVCTKDMVLDGEGTNRVVVFGSKHGVCMAGDKGAVFNLTQDRFEYPVQERGAAMIRRHRGMVQCVVTMQGTEQAGNSAF